MEEIGLQWLITAGKSFLESISLTKETVKKLPELRQSTSLPTLAKWKGKVSTCMKEAAAALKRRKESQLNSSP